MARKALRALHAQEGFFGFWPRSCLRIPEQTILFGDGAPRYRGVVSRSGERRKSQSSDGLKRPVHEGRHVGSFGGQCLRPASAAAVTRVFLCIYLLRRK